MREAQVLGIARIGKVARVAGIARIVGLAKTVAVSTGAAVVITVAVTTGSAAAAGAAPAVVQDAGTTDLEAGLTALREGDVSRAIEALERAVTASDPAPEAFLYLGLARWRIGRLEPAEDALAEATRIEPDSARAHLYLGLVRFDRRHLPQARESLQRAVELDEDEPLAHLGLSSVHLNTMRYDAAERELDLAEDLAPDHPLLHTNRGVLAYRQGDLEAARAHLERALELSPENPRALLYAAEVDVQLGRHDTAESRLRRLLERSGTDVRARYLLAEALEAQGKGVEARIARRAYDLLRGPSPGGMGVAAGDVGELGADGPPAGDVRDQAETDVGGGDPTATTAAAADPDSVARQLMQEAAEARAAGRPDEAVALGNTAAQIDPGLRPVATRLQALVDYDRGDFEAAATGLRSVWEGGGRTLGMATDLALAELQRGNPEGAREVLAAALGGAVPAADRDATLQYLAALAYLQTGQHAQAVAAARRALELDYPGPQPWRVLARAYAAMGLEEQAAEAHRRYEELTGEG